jgi:hypothetical protein
MMLKAKRRQFVRYGLAFREAVEADYARRAGERVSSLTS